MKKLKINRWILKSGLTLLILVSIYVLSYLLNPNSFYWKDLFQDEVQYLLFEFFIMFIFCWGIIELSLFIAKFFEEYIPWTKLPVLRFVIQTISIVVAVVVLFFIQGMIYEIVYRNEVLTQQDYFEIQQFLVIAVVVSLFVTTVHTGVFLLNRWKSSISEAADLKIKAMQLKGIAMQAELQSLRFQLDPHFMFNNFSTLSELINEDKETANKFLENLSRVYRYMIQNLKKDLISLDEEMKFVQAYSYLIKIRYGENVVVDMSIDKDTMNLYIPPISVQLLIENAIKHNIATKEQPLTIQVKAKGSYLSVTNNLQRIVNPFPSTKVGLQNIIDRYKLLSMGDTPLIEEYEREFKVTLILINNR